MLTNVNVMQKVLLKITTLKHAVRDLACVEKALDLSPKIVLTAFIAGDCNVNKNGR